jgi:hypothetical protein
LFFDIAIKNPVTADFIKLSFDKSALDRKNISCRIKIDLKNQKIIVAKKLLSVN